MSRARSNWLQMHARFRPNAQAVLDVDGGRSWTYRELHQDSLRWAATLHRNKIGPGDVVSLLSHNRGEHFALLFACAELGAIFAPMNWRLSAAELLWQLEHARSKLLITGGCLSGRLDRESLKLEDGPGTVLHRSTHQPADTDPWVLMYTSGTTGQPKGALLTHGQLHWNAVNTTLACDLTPSDSTLTFTPLFHTGGLNCLSTPLLHRGGRIVLTEKVDAEQALHLIETQGITLLMGVPTIYQMLAEHPHFAGSDCSTVRDALCGGAPTGQALLQTYLDRGIPLRQGFGMTEVGPNCFSLPPERIQDKLGSVGLLIHHMAARLVDPQGLPVAPGEPGELQLAGPAVFGGYLHDEEATAKAFDGPWFKTGDVLACDPEGFYRVCGRTKEMFISGAENVYPAEIEAALLQCNIIANAAVIGVPDPRWGEVGRAFVEPQPGAHVDEALIRSHLAERLARFKIPKSYVVRRDLPRTASGKIDKQALRQLTL